MIQPVNAIGQIAYVVRDLDAALRYWIEVLGVGPFFLLHSSKIENMQYRGAPTDVEFTAALSYNGAVCVELIQQENDAPSVYLDAVTKRGYGFHHWGVMTDDFDAEVRRYEAMGFPPAFSGSVSIGGRYAYMDCADTLSGMVELIDFPQHVKALFESLQASCVDWDGADPVRQT